MSQRDVDVEILERWPSQVSDVFRHTTGVRASDAGIQLCAAPIKKQVLQEITN
jgi:hypothetical protein